MVSRTELAADLAAHLDRVHAAVVVITDDSARPEAVIVSARWWVGVHRLRAHLEAAWWRWWRDHDDAAYADEVTTLLDPRTRQASDDLSGPDGD
jgi:hypothetical protein